MLVDFLSERIEQRIRTVLKHLPRLDQGGTFPAQLFQSFSDTIIIGRRFRKTFRSETGQGLRITLVCLVRQIKAFHKIGALAPIQDGNRQIVLFLTQELL